MTVVKTIARNAIHYAMTATLIQSVNNVLAINIYFRNEYFHIAFVLLDIMIIILHKWIARVIIF